MNNRPRASLNPDQNSTPKSRTRRTIFNFDSFRVNDPGLNFSKSSDSDTSDLFVFGKDATDDVQKQKSNPKRTENIPRNFAGGNMSNNEIFSKNNSVPSTPENKRSKIVNLNSPHAKPTRSKLLQDLNSPSAFLKIRALQAIRNPEQFVEESDSEDEIATLLAQAPKPVNQLHEVLIGIIAYVEVCNDQDDNSEGVKDMMRRLGATVHNNFLKDVTHVIFKDGRVSTYKKAKSRQIPLLSMLWIEACKIQMYKVCESLYPATGLEEYETMALLQKRNKPIRRMGVPVDDRLKRIRSKNPTNKTNQRLNMTLDDSSSNEAFENRFQKLVDKDTSLSDSSDDLVQTLQKVTGINLEMDNNRITKRNKASDIFEQEPLAVRLMKKFMASRADLKTNTDQNNKNINQKEDIQQSDANKISDLLSKITVSEPDNTNSSTSNNSLSKTNLNKTTTLVESTSDSFYSLEVAYNPVTPIKKKRRTSIKPPTISKNNENLIIQNINDSTNSSGNRESSDSSLRLHLSTTSDESSKSTFCSNESLGNRNETTKSETKETDEIINEINSAVRNVISNRRKSMRIASKDCLVGVNETANAQTLPKSGRSRRTLINKTISEEKEEEPKSFNKTISSICENDLTKNTSIQIENTDTIEKLPEHVLEKIDSVPYFNSPITQKPEENIDQNTPKIIKKRKLYSMYGMNDSTMNSSNDKENQGKEITLDHYFKPRNLIAKPDRKIVQAKRVLTKQTSTKTQKGSIKSFFFPATNSETSQILTDSLVNNLSAIAPIRRSTLEFQKKLSKEELKEKAQKKCVERRVTNIVCTSLHKEETEIAKSVVKKLGGYFLCDSVCTSTSHVISLEPRRTLSMLKGIARGCWILNFEWIIKSDKAGKWLDEDLFEWTSFSSAVQRTRVERKAFGESFKMDIFSTTGSIYISKKCAPPWRELQDLVVLCSGKLVSSYRIADIIVGEIYENQLCVTPSWILDSIINYKVKSINSYIIGESV